MDVQEVALRSAQARVREGLQSVGWIEARGGGDGEGVSCWRRADGGDGGAQLTVHWHRADHAVALESLARRSAALIVFNLGYLPGGDRSVTTTADGTLRALRSAEGLLAVGGCISVTIYPGHSAGAAEEGAVLEYEASLPQGVWSVYYTQWLNQRNKRTGRRAPSLVLQQLLHEPDVGDD